MYINTKAIFEWDDNLKQYVEIHNEGYEYEGELELAQDSYENLSDWATWGTQTGTTSPEEEEPQILGGYGAYASTDPADILRNVYDIDVSNLSPSELGLLYEYDPTSEQYARAGAIESLGGIQSAGASKLYKTRQTTPRGGFAGGGDDLLGMSVEDIYETGGTKRGGTLLSMGEEIAGSRRGYGEELMDIISQIEAERGAEGPGVARVAPEGQTYEQERSAVIGGCSNSQYWNGSKCVEWTGDFDLGGYPITEDGYRPACRRTKNPISGWGQPEYTKDCNF